MELVEIDETNEDVFYRCMKENPLDPRVLAMRRQWRAIHKPRGHRAKLLKDDDGQVVGLTNYIPIEHSPYQGEKLMVVLCVWIHLYDVGPGDQGSKGYGRFMLGQIEDDARRSGCNGVVGAANEFNPFQFFEHMGYERVTQVGYKALVWKPFNGRAKPPALPDPVIPQRGPHNGPGRVQVRSVTDGWCMDCCERCIMIRDVIREIGDKAELTEANMSENMRAQGESFDVVYIDGEPINPDGPPIAKEDFKRACLERFAGRNQQSSE